MGFLSYDVKNKKMKMEMKLRTSKVYETKTIQGKQRPFYRIRPTSRSTEVKTKYE